MDFIGGLWERTNDLPGHTWQWFNSLNREEWIVTLTVACVLGFLCLTGMRSHRF